MLRSGRIRRASMPNSPPSCGQPTRPIDARLLARSERSGAAPAPAVRARYAAIAFCIAANLAACLPNWLAEDTPVHRLGTTPQREIRRAELVAASSLIQ